MSRHPGKFAKQTCVPVLIALLFAVALAPTSATAASPPLFAGVCDKGGGAGQCDGTAIAVDPSTGNVYVADSGNNRIDEFGPWGNFIKAWGGGVLNGGATGTGNVSPGSINVTSFSTTTKAFVRGMLVQGTGIAPGTIIEGLGDHALVLSKPATAAATGTPTTLSSPEAPGNVPTNELQEITVTATGGSFNLRFRLQDPDSGVGETTTNLPYNASAAQVQSALEGLSNIGAGNVAVTSANPGGEAGVPGGPYTVEFKGARYADTDVRELEVEPGAPVLSGGIVKAIETRNGASAPEICTGLANCREGVEGSQAGQIDGLHDIAIDSQGDLYLYETRRSYNFFNCPGPACETRFFGNSRVQKFDSAGSFLLMFGGDVNEGGGSPSDPGDICTAQDLANGDVCGSGIAGDANGQFGTTEGIGLDLSPTRLIATGPADQVYVGDKDRIQRFDSSGNYTGQIPLPEAGSVGALAVDPVTGDLYFSYTGQADSFGKVPQPDIHRLDESSGAVIGQPLKVGIPRAIATDSAGNVYAANSYLTNASVPPLSILKFSPSGDLLETLFKEMKAEGFLATSSACGIAGAALYVGGVGIGNLEVGGFGPTPNPAICPPPQVAPSITDQYAISVDTTGATLKAEINPEFWTDTTYYVQYGVGKCSEGGCDQEKPLAPGSKLTSTVTNSAITTAGVFLSGLEPGTTYHYRFVAQSSGGGPVRGVGGEIGFDGEEATFTTFPLVSAKTDCPNQAFRTAASAKLPDCRAYEMVSPVEKNGGEVVTGPLVSGFKAPRRTSPDGERFTFTSLTSFADPEGAPLVNQYLSSRGPDGWSTKSISPPRGIYPVWLFGLPGAFKAFSEDLCSAWLLEDSNMALTPETPVGVGNLYRRSNCGEEPEYELLTDIVPPGFGPGGIKSEFSIPLAQGFSADGTHTVVRSPAKLTSNACKTAGIYQVYVTSEEGPMRLVSALPNGQASCNHSSAGTFNGSVDSMVESGLVHAISSDGSRVFWTASDEGEPEDGFPGNGPGQLYVRLNATAPPSSPGSGCSEAEKACTLPIYTAGEAFFWGAAADGSKAIYAAGSGVAELFEYDVEEEDSTLIAKGVSFPHYGVAGMSEDASRLYLTSKEVLTTTPNSEGEIAQAGQRNLYFYEAGEGSGSYTFIGTLAREDGSATSDQPGQRTSRVTPDGLHIAFQASTPLTGYDNASLGSGVPATELYVYDAEVGGPGQLRCVSCNPSGVRPVGRIGNGVSTVIRFSATLPGWPEQLRSSRLLLEDGSRLFFQSYDALLPADSNGAQDVYEWLRADSTEDCEEAGAQLYAPSAEGCISLISSGQSPENSEVLEASKGGADIFFVTNSSLLPQDRGLFDVYDARVNGGYPPPPSPTPACEGEACQGVPTAPNDPTPASSSYDGAGNVVEKPAKKKAKKKAKKQKKKAHKRKQANKTRRAGR